MDNTAFADPADDEVGQCTCGEQLFRWEEDPDVAGMYVCIYCGKALELYH